MLQAIDLSQSLPKKVYKRELLRSQLKLRQLAYQLYLNKRTLIVVYEGLDAAGKSSNIKRLTEKLDPRGYEVYSIAPPEEEDKTHHYLWRFWRCLTPPEKKQILVFNRSWYGRVLDERVEGIYPKAVWRRAYREINEFERQLVDFGIIVAKFWLHISPEEQLKRLEARAKAAHKAWRVTEETWDHRRKWDLYEEAVEDMLLRTSTVAAPWMVVESDDKYHARVKTVETLVRILTKELNFQPEDVLQSPDETPRDRARGDSRTSNNGTASFAAVP